MLVTIENRKIGSFKLDAVTSENHKSALKITDNPIESGATVTDHAVLQPQSVTVSGVIVRVDPPHLEAPLPGGTPFLDGTSRLAGVLPPFVVSLPESLTLAKQVYSDFKVFNDTVRDVAPGLAPFLPDYGTNNNKPDRISQMHGAILELQRQAVLLVVMTGTRLYKNMLIQSVDVTQDNDNVARFTIVTRQANIVDIVVTNVVEQKISKSAGGRAGEQSSGATHSTVQPQPEKRTSALKGLFG